MKKLSLLFLLSARALSGGVLVVRQQAKLLAEKGHDVTVAYLYESKFDHCDETIFSSIAPAQEVMHADLQTARSFDVAVATWWETAYYIALVEAASYAYFVQGFEDRFYPRESVWPLLVQRTYQAGFNFIVVSTALARYLLQEFGRSASIVSPGVNIADYDCQPLIAPAQGKLRVLVEGSPDAALKRVDRAFQALSAVEGLDVVYVSPEGKAKDEWVVDHFFEAVANDRMPAIYKSCDLILKLSTDESFSLPVMEAFAAGATAVVSDFYGGSDFIRDGENALVVPVDDLKATVEALIKLRDDKGLLDKLRRSALETARQYGWSAVNARMEEALKQAYEAGRPHNPPLSGCLEALKAAHQARQEQCQYRQEYLPLVKEHESTLNLLAVEQLKVSDLRNSRSYRLGNRFAKAYRLIAGR